MKSTTALLLIIMMPLFLSCISQDKKDDVQCTMEYRMLMVSVKDPAALPVVLDRHYVVKSSTGDTLDFSKEDPYADSIYRIQGSYIIFTDGKMGMTSKEGALFEFHGLLNGVEIVNEKYLIGKNDCHVQLRSGNTAIIIPR
ncbi:MAG: hypothetical protein NT040_05230 [Bacteroidetes bacterium]|nr:hypothetical protein [Bacteroidota bacterium]